jgi:hypothetical protein
VWNSNPLKTGDNRAYGAQVDYPNDRWSGRLTFTEVQPNVNPAVGFTRRRGFREYNSVMRFAPRQAANPLIRQLTFSAANDIKAGMDNRLLTRVVDITAFRMQLHSQDSVEIHVIPSYERLERDFEISQGVVLRTGGTHSFTRYKLQASTADQRVLSTQSSVEAGDFFSGERREVNTRLSVRPRAGVLLNLEGEWNGIDLPEGRFETRVFRLVADTQFSPWTYLVNNVQFDSVSANIGWQARLRWILRPGNDLFLVYLHNWHDDVVRNRFMTVERRAATKFVYDLPVLAFRSARRAPSEQRHDVENGMCQRIVDDRMAVVDPVLPIRAEHRKVALECAGERLHLLFPAGRQRSAARELFLESGRQALEAVAVVIPDQRDVTLRKHRVDLRRTGGIRCAAIVTTLSAAAGLPLCGIDGGTQHERESERGYQRLH